MPWYEVVHKTKTVEQWVFSVEADSEEAAEQMVRDHSDYENNDTQSIRFMDYCEDVVDTDYDCEGECDDPGELAPTECA